MGGNVKEAEKVDELKLPNGNDTEKEAENVDEQKFSNVNELKNDIEKEAESIGEQKLSNENDMKNDFEKEAEKVDEQKLPNGNEAKKEPEPRESSQEEKPTAQSCCQGDDRISCCREQTADEELPLQKTKTSCCQSTNGNSSGSNEVLEKEVKKPLGRLRSWAGKWEQHEVYAAAGVVGAVATAGVVYSLYRRSR